MRRNQKLIFPNRITPPKPPPLERFTAAVSMDAYPGPAWEAIVHTAFPQVAQPGDMYRNTENGIYYICIGKGVWDICTNADEFM